MTVDILLEEPRWAESGLDRIAEPACHAALSGAGLRPDDWDISLLACNDRRIAELNSAFRDKSQPTNVLSWPSAERGAATPGAIPPTPDAADPELGDLALAFETCRREAETGGITLAAHATHLLVHGTLHLLGYDHEDDGDAAVMEALEIEILASLGVANPY